MKIRVVLLSCALVLAGDLVSRAADTHANAPAPKPSFDCATAKSRIDVLICSNAGLAALDVREAAMLRRAKAKAVTPDAVDAEQDVWLSQRNACTSVACLTRAYQRRLQELRAWTD